MRNRPTKTQILYANGNLGKSSVSSLMELFGLIYLTDVLGILPHVAGFFLMISLIWDGISDPIVGVLADKYRHRWKSITPYFLTGTPIIILSFLAFFHLFHFPNLSEPWLIVLILLIFRTGYTIVDIPHNSLFAFIANSPQDGTIIAGFRIFFSALGKLIATAATAFLVSQESSQALATGLSQSGFILLFIMVLSFVLCNLVTQATSFLKENNKKFSFHSLIKVFWRVRELTALFVLTSINSLLFPALGTFIVYLDSENTGYGTMAFGAICIAFFQMISLWFWSKLANATGNLRALQISYLVLSTSSLIGFVFDDVQSSIALYMTASIIGFSMGGIAMLNWSLLPSTVRHAEKVGCDGCEISIFSLYTLVNKIAAGFSQVFLGYILFLYGYNATKPSNIDVLSNTAIPLFSVVLFCCFASFFICRVLKSRND